MNWLTDKINEGREHVSRTGILTVITAIIGLIAFRLLKDNYPSLQFLGVMTMLLSFGMGGYWAIDKWVLTTFSFSDEIKNGNVSAGIAFAAILLFIGICELCAFAVFFTLR